MLKVIDTCEVLVCSVLEFGMDHINNLKLEDLRVILHYHFGSEKLKVIQEKVDLVESVTEFLESIGGILHSGVVCEFVCVCVL